MNLSTLVRLLQTMNWDALQDGRCMRFACEQAIIAKMQELQSKGM